MNPFWERGSVGAPSWGVMAHSVGLRAPYILCLVVLATVIIIELSLIKKNPQITQISQINMGQKNSH